MQIFEKLRVSNKQVTRLNPDHTESGLLKNNRKLYAKDYFIYKDSKDFKNKVSPTSFFSNKKKKQHMHLKKKKKRLTVKTKFI